MDEDAAGEVAVALGIRGAALRCDLHRCLEGVGCRVQAFDDPDALEAEVLAPPPPSLVIAEATWLSGSPLATRYAGRPPLIAVERGDALRHDGVLATARVRVDDPASSGRRVAFLARHLIEQDRRWNGAWVSTGLLQAVARSEVPDA